MRRFKLAKRFRFHLEYRKDHKTLAYGPAQVGRSDESWAFKEIGDRLEGKPMQPIEYSDADDRTSIEEFTDAELSAILRSRLKIVTSGVELTHTENPQENAE
jgi:hypothetical protein